MPSTAEHQSVRHVTHHHDGRTGEIRTLEHVAVKPAAQNGVFHVLAKPFVAGLRTGFHSAFTGFAPIQPPTRIPALWRGETNPKNGFFVIRDDFGRVSADFERGVGCVKRENPEIEFDFPRKRA